MKKLCLLAFLCPFLTRSQQTPLAVGDTLSAAVMLRLPVGGTAVAPDAVVILDFWASWCGTCSKGIARLDSLDSLFGPQLDVVLINSHHTGDDRAKVEKYKAFFNNKYGKLLPFPVLVGDSIFLELFPHDYIPFYVWLQRGKVRAITSRREINRENIEAVLRDPQFRIRSRDEELTGSVH